MKTEPNTFQLETTTVWQFPQRGTWATHDGTYRGNWSPYIPRNILLRFSHQGDIVLDSFGVCQEFCVNFLEIFVIFFHQWAQPFIDEQLVPDHCPIGQAV